jgi:hypothetical protein
MTTLTEGFNKRHAGCPKEWVEPSPEETKTLSGLKAKMQWWVENGEHGTSSKTIYNIVAKSVGSPVIQNHFTCHPSDPDDFRRCHLLIEAVPEIKPLLYLMKPLSKTWSALVDNRDTLTAMLQKAMKSKSGKAPEMYELMKKIGC